MRALARLKCNCRQAVMSAPSRHRIRYNRPPPSHTHTHNVMFGRYIAGAARGPCPSSPAHMRTGPREPSWEARVRKRAHTVQLCKHMQASGHAHGCSPSTSYQGRRHLGKASQETKPKQLLKPETSPATLPLFHLQVRLPCAYACTFVAIHHHVFVLVLHSWLT